ncbi:hypothetical protein DL767_001091 [Monosporascus sp. MG133]|nr:hypothetical protein DL767_001091 [Monosporascus sp. MG133]
MQFSVLSVLAMGLVASAAPEVQARGGGGGGGGGKKDVCCDAVLSCVVVVGDACPNGHTHWHCKTDDDEGSKVDVLDVSLDCVKVL